MILSLLGLLLPAQTPQPITDPQDSDSLSQFLTNASPEIITIVSAF